MIVSDVLDKEYVAMPTYVIRVEVGGKVELRRPAPSLIKAVSDAG